MAGTITIQTIAFDTVVSVDQVVTVSHKLATEPDTSFVVDTTTQLVHGNGVFDPELVISGLLYQTHYTVMVANSCGGDSEVAYLTLITGENPCPDILTVYGTVY